MTTDSRTPTKDMLITALEQLEDQGQIRGWATPTNNGVWTVAELGGTERTFEEAEHLDNYLQTDHNTVALFRPVETYENDDRKAIVKRDTSFDKTWMISRYRKTPNWPYKDTRYEGCVTTDDLDEAKEYAQAWIEKDTVFFNMEDFRAE